MTHILELPDAPVSPVAEPQGAWVPVRTSFGLSEVVAPGTVIASLVIVPLCHDGTDY